MHFFFLFTLFSKLLLFFAAVDSVFLSRSFFLSFSLIHSVYFHIIDTANTVYNIVVVRAYGPSKKKTRTDHKTYFLKVMMANVPAGGSYVKNIYLLLLLLLLYFDSLFSSIFDSMNLLQTKNAKSTTVKKKQQQHQLFHALNILEIEFSL